MIKKSIGPKGNYEANNYDSSDMEAKYSDIEQEERRAERIAKKEDAE